MTILAMTRWPFGEEAGGEKLGALSRANTLTRHSNPSLRLPSWWTRRLHAATCCSQFRHFVPSRGQSCSEQRVLVVVMVVVVVGTPGGRRVVVQSGSMRRVGRLWILDGWRKWRPTRSACCVCNIHLFCAQSLQPSCPWRGGWEGVGDFTWCLKKNVSMRGESCCLRRGSAGQQSRDGSVMTCGETLSRGTCRRWVTWRGNSLTAMLHDRGGRQLVVFRRASN